VRSMQKPIRTMTSLAVLAMMASHAINAGGFSLYTEGSAAAIGNFAAGIAAEGADASIGWYNPAGLVLLKKQQAVLGGVGVFPSTQLTGSSLYSTPNLFDPTEPNLTYAQTFSGLQAAKSALVPSLHYALPLNDMAVFGLSIVAPFGLSTDYEKNSPVRYAATLSKLETFTLSPELGHKITKHFSLGVGVDLQYARVTFNRMIGSPAYLQYLELVVPQEITPYTLDSESKNTGDSFGVGFHLGGLLRFSEDHTRLGLNYQSHVNHNFSGRSQLTGRFADPALNIFAPGLANPNASFYSNTLSSNSIALPGILTLSGYQDVNDKLALLGSVVYSQWSSFKEITLNNVAVGVPDPDLGTTTLTTRNATTTEGYRDTWRLAIGANYHVNDQWMMRIGGGYDQTPTVNAHRDVRLPDSNRGAVAIGVHYQAFPSVGFDVGYSYLFATNDAIINNTQPIATSTYNVTATSKNHAQLVGLQAVWKLDQEKASMTTK